MKTNHSAIPMGGENVCFAPRDIATILWTEPGHQATKQFSRSKRNSEITVAQYDAGYLYTVFDPIGVNDIEELSMVLTFSERYPRGFIIRGEPVSADLIGPWVTRTGSGEGENFVGNFKTPTAGRYYLEIDVDKFVLPKGWKLTADSVQEILEHIVGSLPKEFHNATYHWQLSSSAGVFDTEKVSVHLWFFLIRPIPDPELRRWAKYVNAAIGFKLVDFALFQHVQPHYTAAPLFSGMDDPFPVRSGLNIKQFDSVDLQLPPIEIVPDQGVSTGNRQRRSEFEGGFEFFLNKIGDHSGGDGFHRPIIQSVASYVAEHGSEGTDTEYLYSTVRDRVLSVDFSKHSHSEVAERASGSHILSAIASAQRKFGALTDQRRKTRRIEGIPPHFQGEFKDPIEIQRALHSLLDDAF